MTAPAWMTAEQAAAHERGVTNAQHACSAVAHHEPAQPTYDPDYRPRVRTASSPSAPYRPTGRNPLDPWWERYAGLACTCPPGCTHRTWGDGGTCVRSCVPCTEMHGQTYSRIGSRGKRAA
jgi:hypothetical protein